MLLAADRGAARSRVPVAVVLAALSLLAMAVVTDSSPKKAALLLVVVTATMLLGTARLSWEGLLAALILIILFIPIRRYTFPGHLPLQLEPYRLFVAILVLGWIASLLSDRRTRFRWTGFEAPIGIIVFAAFASIVANPGRVATFSSEVMKKLAFFLSFILVVYITASVIRRLDSVERLAKTLVGGGAVVAFFAIVEARTGFNVFNHLTRVLPILREPGDAGDPGGFNRVGTAKLRVFASAQHPIALSATLVMLVPLALYLARRRRQRRWYLCALTLLAGCASTVSRTGIMMILVVVIVFLWLRPRETRRLWPAVIPLLLAIHFVLPGTLGAIKQSFFPAGGLVAEQKSMAGQGGSGRIADLGPALREWAGQPLLGEGFGTRVTDPTVRGPQANVLDDQWLGTLLETGAVGILGWAWLFCRAVRRYGAEAKEDDSDRGWLLTALAAGVASYAVGMLTYDAFTFIQVTFLVFIFLGLGSALLAERPMPLAVRMSNLRPEAQHT